MSPKANRRLWWLAVLLIVSTIVLAMVTAPVVRVIQQPDPLAVALQRSHAAGSYHFSSDITQVTVPASKVTNVGRTGHTYQMHMEGQTNLADQSMQMRLWSQQGSISDPTSGVAVKIEGGKTYVQEGQGTWKEQEGLTDGFAPEGDFMAFLTAMRDPVAHPPETINNITFVRYTFRLDGPALASHIRDQMEAKLRKQGELTEGLALELPAYFRDMTGDGELWVGSDGLPLRQILRMQFPEQRGETVRAEIVTNFSEFGQSTGVATGAVHPFVQHWLPRLKLALGLLALVLVACGALFLSWNRPIWRARIWRGVAMFLIVALSLNPLLSDLRIARVTTAQAARAVAQEQQREERRQQEDMQARLAAPQIDPHASPLEGAKEIDSFAQAVPNGAFNPAKSVPSLAVSSTAVVCEDPADTDCDDDGLSNFDEETVGTDPFYSDTDEDGVNDLTEVMGFLYADQHWYMDANAVDSNNDGIEDGTEFDTVNQQPIDTNNDGIPDVFDPDNDGDGVQDSKDLSPFSVTPTTFTKDAPLNLTLKNLTPKTPAFVDFQIRPVNEKHLWFAYNVLDWPKDDNKGHVQDIDDKTFGDLPGQPADPTPGDSSYNGDMKLIPMLEIRMSDGGANLPQDDALAPYNIRAQKLNDSGNEWVVYVPLSLITDQNTGERMAFSGRMFYNLNGDLTSEPPQPFVPIMHQVRMVWMVQMLMDIPCDPTRPEDVEKGCKADKYIHNDPKLVQTYYDDWKLTGLNLKEDHGAKTAVIYEVPPANSTLPRDAALTALAYGLEKSFLSARDQDGDNVRDVDLDEIARRFDSSDAIEVSEDERWNIPPDILRVERNDYATIDEAIKTTGMETTPDILATYFDATWEVDNSIEPLLMYTQELSSRGIGMDGVAEEDGSVTLNGSEIVIDLHPDGQDSAPLMVIASLKWTPYCKNVETGSQWSECELGQWWDSLEQRNSDPYPGDPPDDEQLDAGRTMSLILYATVLWQGVSQIVEINNTRVSVGPEPLEDGEIAGLIHTGLSATGSLIRFFVNTVAMAAFENPVLQEALTYDLGLIWQIIKRDVIKANVQALKGLFAHTKLIIGLAVVLVAYLAWSIYAGFQGDWNWAYGGISLIVVSLAAYILVVQPIITLFSQATSLGSLLAMRSEVLGTSRTAARVGTLISLGIIWGFFLYNVIANQVPFLSLQFNQALSATIALTIYIILLAVLSLTGVGTVLVGLITLVDLILMIGCQFWDPFWETGDTCWSISGTVTTFITNLIYSSAPMVDVMATNLVKTGILKLQLAHEDWGYIAGNDVSVSVPVTTTITHKSPYPDGGWHIYFYPWFFSEENLRSTTFKYSLTSPSPAPITVDRFQMLNEWQGITSIPIGQLNMYSGYANATPPPFLNINGLQAGVNKELPFYLNMGYAFPAYECWTLPLWAGVGLLPIPICNVRTISGNNLEESNKPENEKPILYLDILPATLDDFMKLAGEVGYALAWDEKFETLNDADNDGLPQSSNMDPNDSLWDTDGDGLSDTFEVDKNSSGVVYSPEDCDTDDDGLTDRQEVLFGTAPDQRDTDHDGLLDSEEVVHENFDGSCQPTGDFVGGWQISLSFGSITVHSDPLSPDTDGDGANDKDEYTWATDPTLESSQRLDLNGYPYHPGVPNTPWVLVSGEPDTYTVRPGVNLNYTTTVVTKISLVTSDLVVTLTGSDGGTIGTPQTYSLEFPFLDQPVTQGSTLPMPPAPYSGLVYITSTFSARQSNGTITPVTARTAIRVDEEKPSSQIDSLDNLQYLQGNATGDVFQIIGGSASDNTSGIAKVEVSVNSGEWMEASGAETWTFPLQVSDGAYTIQSRATDGAGNVEDPGPGIEVFADGNPPTFTFNDPVEQPVVPGRAASGQWTVPLSGNIMEPDITEADKVGSGIYEASVQVRLQSTGSEDQVIGDWQTVTITDIQWSIDYHFPSGMADPTGSWTPEMRASDLIGNTRQEMKPSPALEVDIAAPVPTLSEEVLARPSMNGSMSLSGAITDHISGVDKLEVAFVPYSQVEPVRDTVLWLSFDEQANSAYWADRSGHDNAASCLAPPGKTCPSSGQPGRIGGGLTLVQGYGQGVASVADAGELNFPAGAGFSVQAWFKPDGYAYGDIVYKQGAYYLGDGEGPGVYWALESTEGEYHYYYIGGGPEPIGDEWYHVVGTFDPQPGEEMGKMQLFLNGQLVGEGSAPNNLAFSSVEPVTLGSHTLDGVVDEVIITQHALSEDEVQALYQAGTRLWHPATLAQHGSGIAQTTWSLPVPAGLEGIYQIDLRGWDVLGNYATRVNAWRGPIDTLAPRLILEANQTNEVYINPRTAQRRIGVHYKCAAEDTFLDESTFQCPGANLPPPTRSFVQDSILLGLFPDLTLLSGLANEWTQWQSAGSFTASMSACDLWGNCKTQTLESTMDVLPGAEPLASVVFPTSGAMVASDGTLDVTVAASAPQLLKELTLSLDGTIIKTINFVWHEAPIFTQQVVAVTASEGEHTLVAMASDWAGNIQDHLFPVSFTLDITPPEVAILTTEITSEDIYHKGSPILRFNGTASDTLCLAGVQMRVNGGPFADTTIVKNGGAASDYTWSVAYFVNAPEGLTLNVTARATDCAGHTSEVSQVIPTDLSSPDAPDTQILSTPGSISEPHNALFTFVAIQGGKDVAGLMCQLDDGVYTACISPYTLDWLSVGQHTLRVRAVDVEGNVDLTPASHTWTVVSEMYKLLLPLVVAIR